MRTRDSVSDGGRVGTAAATRGARSRSRRRRSRRRRRRVGVGVGFRFRFLGGDRGEVVLGRGSFAFEDVVPPLGADPGGEGSLGVAHASIQGVHETLAIEASRGEEVVVEQEGVALLADELALHLDGRDGVSAVHAAQEKGPKGVADGVAVPARGSEALEEPAEVHVSADDASDLEPEAPLLALAAELSRRGVPRLRDDVGGVLVQGEIREVAHHLNDAHGHLASPLGRTGGLVRRHRLGRGRVGFFSPGGVSEWRLREDATVRLGGPDARGGSRRTRVSSVETSRDEPREVYYMRRWCCAVV